MEHPRSAPGLKYTEMLNLRWNSFEANAKVVFMELREEREFLDVTVVAGDGRQIQANKFVLAAGSYFFLKILRENPHPHPLICLNGVSYKNLSHVLDFVYTGETDIDKDDLDEFLDIADDLKVKGLTKEDKTAKTNVQQTSVTPAPLQSQVAPEEVATSPNLSTLYQNEVVHEETPTSPRESAPHQGHAALEKSATLPGVFAKQQRPVAAQKRSREPTVSYDNGATFDVDHDETCDVKVEVDDAELYNGFYGTNDFSEEYIQHVSKRGPGQNEMTGMFAGQKLNYQVFSTGKKFKEGIMDSSSDKVVMEVAENVSQNKQSDKMMLAMEGKKRIDKEEMMDSTCDMVVAGSEDSAFINKQASHDWGRQNEENDNMIQDEEQDDYGEAYSSEEKNAWCSICNKTFKHPSALKIHKRKHTGEKPFECLACQTKFPSCSNLYKHKRKIHGASCYQCELCGEIFSNGSDLKCHLSVKDMCSKNV